VYTTDYTRLLSLGRLSDTKSRPGGSRRQSGEFLLPYEVVRTAPDPDGTLLAFCQSTYGARRTSRLGSGLRSSAALTNSVSLSKLAFILVAVGAGHVGRYTR
jgi:hypothetical protein